MHLKKYARVSTCRHLGPIKNMKRDRLVSRLKSKLRNWNETTEMWDVNKPSTFSGHPKNKKRPKMMKKRHIKVVAGRSVRRLPLMQLYIPKKRRRSPQVSSRESGKKFKWGNCVQKGRKFIGKTGRETKLNTRNGATCSSSRSRSLTRSLCA